MKNPVITIKQVRSALGGFIGTIIVEIDDVAAGINNIEVGIKGRFEREFFVPGNKNRVGYALPSIQEKQLGSTGYDALKMNVPIQNEAILAYVEELVSENLINRVINPFIGEVIANRENVNLGHSIVEVSNWDGIPVPTMELDETAKANLAEMHALSPEDLDDMALVNPLSDTSGHFATEEDYLKGKQPNAAEPSPNNS